MGICASQQPVHASSVGSSSNDGAGSGVSKHSSNSSIGGARAGEPSWKAEEAELTLHIAVLGEARVGKTALLSRFVPSATLSSKSMLSSGSLSHSQLSQHPTRRVLVDGRRVAVKVMEAGEYAAAAKQQPLDGVLLVVDATSKAPFDKTYALLDEVYHDSKAEEDGSPHAAAELSLPAGSKPGLMAALVASSHSATNSPSARSQSTISSTMAPERMSVIAHSAGSAASTGPGGSGRSASAAAGAGATPVGLALNKADRIKDPAVMERVKYSGRLWGEMNRCTVTMTSGLSGYGVQEAFADLVRRACRRRLSTLEEDDGDDDAATSKASSSRSSA